MKHITAGCLSLALSLAMIPSPRAGITEGGGTGILDVDTPETLPGGRLSLSLSPRYGYLDASQSRLHTFVGNTGLTLGLSGGFEASAVLPFHALFRTDTDAGAGAIFEEDFAFRARDLELKFRKAFPLGGERLRFALEALGTAPIGSDRLESIYAPGDSLKPFTGDEWNYGAMALVGLDLTGPTGNAPIRLHVNVGYYLNRNESEYRYRTGFRYPLPVPPPTESKDNDLMLLGAGLEFPLGRLSAFGELFTEQLVNRRDVLDFKENPITLNGGLRFLFPGGVGLTTGLSLNLSGDDGDTAFDPGKIYPDWEVRASLSFGDVLQSRRHRLARNRAEAAADTAITDSTATVPSGDTPGPTPAAPTSPSRRPAPGDADGDGIPDDQDRCPQLAEDWDGFRDLDGCPDLDNDQDGVLDVDDLCPNSPEDFLAPNPTDGCPSPFRRPDPRASTESPGSAEPAVEAVPPGNTPDRAPPDLLSGLSATARFPDADGDGVPDSMDRCPLLAEDFDGYQDEDGCPDLDNDGDGIQDDRDRCPNGPETWNGYDDDDGCPDTVPVFPEPDAPTTIVVPGPARTEAPTLEQLRLTHELADLVATLRVSPMPNRGKVDPRADWDGDGVGDLYDRCPEIKEDVDGWQDEDGCPDLDNDADGIPDVRDACPLRAETFNNFEDEDGCPDEIPAVPTEPAAPTEPASPPETPIPVPAESTPVEESTVPERPIVRPELLCSVGFESGGDGLDDADRAAIDAVVPGILQSRRPLDIVGYSDDRGAAEANLRLSATRARRVLEYLAGAGIPIRRMRSTARGEADPVADNDTAEGRALNRRVEIVLLPDGEGSGP